MRLIDSRMADGTRHFGSLPEGNDPASPDWERFRDHVARLDGARLTNYVTDEICEAWIDFEWRGHAFQLNNQYGEWWLFVADPACPDAVLEDVSLTSRQSLRPTIPCRAPRARRSPRRRSSSSPRGSALPACCWWRS